ncbi:FAD-binding oxidoreductase [cyanobiont of Ornithocercus magnificus]|nr:FAD-binding oxidoreductase [cyanobiont of Ornithocercus magnificus]
MGNIFSRSSGRSWRLRQRSMALWPIWLKDLQHLAPSTDLSLRQPLIQLAASGKEAVRLQSLAHERSELGLTWLPAELTTASILSSGRSWPDAQHGALLSRNDGCINPLALQAALRKALILSNVTMIASKACYLEHLKGKKSVRWRLGLETGAELHCETVILCAARESSNLLQNLGRKIPQEPILGQALTLETEDDSSSWANWPAVMVSRGVNLIPIGPRRLWLGATIEPGQNPSPRQIDQLRELEGDAPAWLKRCSVVNHWHGERARPKGQAAPLLMVVEPGLILAAGHYRNGVLLMPATAEWVGNQIM